MLFKKIGTLLQFILNFVNNLITSFGKFGKSSYLSLLFLGIILLMVQALEQANTLLVDMIESDPWSLLFCFMVIAVFASVLSHYPRYIYYAENINDSRDDHKWYAYKWFGYAIFIFSKIENNVYKQDYKAKFFRQSLGLIIFIIWNYYIYQTFYSKIYFSGLDVSMIRLITIVISIIPAIVLITLLDKMNVYQDKLLELKSDEAIALVKSQKREFVKRGLYSLFVFAGLVIVFGLIILLTIKFSLYGYWLLQMFTFLIALLYIMFRVFRVYAKTIHFNRYYFLSSSVGYLRYYFVFFILVILFLIYSNIAVFYKWKLSNAMLILLANIFVIYYALACLVKYFFMISIFKSQKEDLENNPKVTKKSYLNNSGVLKKNWNNLVSLEKQKTFSMRRRRIASITTLALIILVFVSISSETQIHELQSFKTVKNENILDIEVFKDSLRNKTDKPLFFVAAHGGGLKANIWTMKVLNEIQTKTDGVFLDQTISFSGASGGMMGVSLYSVLGGQYTNDFETIGQKIDDVAQENFASKDLALTFGYDFVRKIYPLNNIGKYRDRSYYSMVTYRNLLESETSMTLDSLSFNSYWKTNIFDNKKGYFPSLIVNTAKTNGRRGVFYSVKYPDESTIFYNSDNLSQLRNNNSIAYYEAISSTNRFPALSPAAKIKGYGHYIDAGALDNSGLLSSLDLYNYLQKDSTLNRTKKVFVEIINGRNNYIWHLVEKFKTENKITHLKIDEIEQDNIVADLKTGFNLDKIPNYLSDFLRDRSKEPLIDYVPIYLPFQIEFVEVESFLGGELLDKNQISKLQSFLKRENSKVKKQIDDNDYEWKTYEPTLARHLSKSTIHYYDRVIQSTLITDQINDIKSLLNQHN